MFLDDTGNSYTGVGYESDQWGPTAVLLHPRSMEKIGNSVYTPQRLIDFMGNLRPRDDGRYLLLNALGAGEYWGVNKNGDYFPEWSLRGDEPTVKVKEYVRSKSLPMPPLWGYKTFELFAYPFRHHNNSDPVNAIGERVLCAAYNERMHRVELVIFIDKSKAPDLVDKIDKGEPIPWSMGAKLLWDSCSICGNAARNRGEYCEHLKFALNKIFPDGRKVFAYNYFPRFFDISAVFVPADRSAYSLRKVASDMGGIDLGLAHPAAAFQSLEGMAKFAGMLDFLQTGGSKVADIEKEIPPAPAKNLGAEPISPDLWKFIFDLVKQDREECDPISTQKLKELRDHPMDKVLSALTSAGMVLKPKEVEDLTQGNEESVPKGLDFSDPDPTILSKIKNLVGSRSMFEPHFTMRVIKIVKRPGEPTTGCTLEKSAAYEKYKRMLRDGVNLGKLAEVVSHPRVVMALNPDSLENQIIGVKTASRLSFDQMVAPFVAAISSGD